MSASTYEEEKAGNLSKTEPTKQPEPPQYAPQQQYPYYPSYPYQPYPYQMPPVKKERNPKIDLLIAESLLYLSGFFGIMFWIFFILVWLVEWKINFTNPWHTGFLAFTVIMFLGCVAGFVGGICVRMRNFVGAMISGILALFSFGWFASTVMALISLIIVYYWREMFVRITATS